MKLSTALMILISCSIFAPQFASAAGRSPECKAAAKVCKDKKGNKKEHRACMKENGCEKGK